MIHVLNPYQLSTSMLRLAAFTFETQLSFVRAFTHMTTHANPVYVTREAIMAKGKKDSLAEDSKPVAKPKPKTKPVVVVAKTAAPKPAAKSTTVRKTTAKPSAAAKTPAPKPAGAAAKPVAKTVAPEPVAKTVAPEPVAKTAAPKAAAKVPAPKVAAPELAAKAALTPSAPASKPYRAPSKPPAMPSVEAAKTKPDTQK